MNGTARGRLIVLGLDIGLAGLLVSVLWTLTHVYSNPVSPLPRPRDYSCLDVPWLLQRNIDQIQAAVGNADRDDPAAPPTARPAGSGTDELRQKIWYLHDPLDLEFVVTYDAVTRGIIEMSYRLAAPGGKGGVLHLGGLDQHDPHYTLTLLPNKANPAIYDGVRIRPVRVPRARGTAELPYASQN